MNIRKNLFLLVLLICVPIYAVPDSATYLSIMTINGKAVADGYLVGMIGAQKPGNMDDESYEGNVGIRVIEQNPNGSTQLFAFGYGMLTPVEYIDMSEGMPIFFLKNTESEYVIIQAYDIDDILKPSHTLPAYFSPRGGNATKLEIQMPSRISSDMSMDLASYVLAVDNEGLIDPEYGIMSPSFPFAFDAVTLEVIEETNPDTSTTLSAMFSDEELYSISMPLISGIGIFSVYDDEIEDISIQAFSNLTPPIADSEPFEVSVVDPSEGILAGLFSFWGNSSTVGFSTSLLSMVLSFSIDGPDRYNNTTQLQLNFLDITGTSSFSSEPTGFQTFTNGVIPYSVTNSEADSFGIIPLIDTRGTPSITIFPFNPCFKFYPEGRATKLIPLSDHAAGVNDTLEILILAVDDYATIDESYQGYIEFEVDDDPKAQSVTVVDLLNGNSGLGYLIAELRDGYARIGLTNFEDETISCSYRDAEGEFMLAEGYLGSGQSYYEYVFYPSITTGATAYEIIYPQGEMPAFFQNYPYTLTVLALDSEGNVDLDYSGSADIVILSGSVDITPTSLNFVRGKATFNISSNVVGDVDFKVVGDLTEARGNVYFYSSSEGGALYSDIVEDKLIVGKTKDFFLVLFTAFGVNTSFSGNSDFSFVDPNENGSLTVPRSVSLTNGFGTFTICNTDPEIITLSTNTHDESIADFIYDLRFYLLTDVVYESEMGIDETDTIFIRTVDYEGNIYPWNTEVRLFIEEEFSNSSVTLSRFTVEIIDGEGWVTISNSEVENVTLSVLIDDEYLIGLPDWEEMESNRYRVGTLNFSYVGIKENLPEKYYISSPYPNPFNCKVNFEVHLDKSTPLKLSVYNLMGQRVDELKWDKLPAGKNNIGWNAKNYPSGLYLYHLEAEGFGSSNGKLILMK